MLIFMNYSRLPWPLESAVGAVRAEIAHWRPSRPIRSELETITRISRVSTTPAVLNHILEWTASDACPNSVYDVAM